MGTFHVLKLPLGFIRVLEWVSYNFVVFLPHPRYIYLCETIRANTYAAFNSRQRVDSLVCLKNPQIGATLSHVGSTE